MTEHTIIYGATSDDVYACHDALAPRFAFDFAMRDSEYWGGDYFLVRSAAPFAETLKLHRNRDVYDGTPILRGYGPCGVLLHCEGVQDAAGLDLALQGLGYTKMRDSAA